MNMKSRIKDYNIHSKVIPIIAIFYILLTVIVPFINTPLQKIEAINNVDTMAKMQINAGGDEAITGDVINEWYANTTRKNGKLAGMGEQIVQTADKYGINRGFFVALMDMETTSGLNPCFGSEYNFGCIRGSKPSSAEDGLEAQGKLMIKYAEGTITGVPKNPTVQEFINVYSPSKENDHNKLLTHYHTVLGYLGVDAEDMQKSGLLKNGDPSATVDYSVDSDVRSLAEHCPINCDLVEEQRVNDYNNGANTGNLQILPEGQTWKNEGSIQDTDLGYTTDKATRANLAKFIGDNGLSDSEEYAGYFYEAGQSSGLDPRFLYAFWSVNTSNGTSEAWTSSNNAFGWVTGGDFSTPKEGIIEGAKLISINYYNGGQNTLKKMVEDSSGHIVSADENWAKAIASIMQKSESVMGESSGKIPNDMAVATKDTWVNEQCYGEGTTGKAITGSNYTEQVINALRDEGLTDESIAGILGNMQEESYINPNTLQGHTAKESEALSDEERDTRLVNHTKGAYAAGIVQWEAPRFASVRAEASKLGVSPYTMEPQMIVLIRELKQITAGSYGSGNLYDFYQTNTDIYTATASFAQYFERCKACKTGTGEFDKRTLISKEIYSTYF